MNSNNAIASSSNLNDSNSMNINGPAWTSKPKKKKVNKIPFNRSTSSSLNTPLEEIEAPYLNHNIRHHGVYTLSPPDNMGRRRQPDLEFNNNNNDNNNLNDLTIDNSKNKKGKEKRKKKNSKVVDPEILQAVENLGRTPSPLPLMTSSNQGVLLRPIFDRNSGNSLSLGAQSFERTNSSVLDARRDLGEGTSSGAERLYNRDDLFEDDDIQDQPLPVFIPSAPLLSTIDSHSQLLPSDPSSLYDPPPAYPSPPPSATASSTVSLLPTPLLLHTSSPSTQNQIVEVESDGDESQEEEFTFHASDPFVIAWESDRRAGLSLDERILRDLLRRKGSNVVPIDSIDDISSTLSSVSVFEAAASPSGIFPSTSTTSSLLNPTAQTPIDENLISPHIRNEIQSAELAQDTPRVARALSVLASNRRSSICLASRGRRVIGRPSGRVSGVGEEESIQPIEVQEAVNPAKEEETAVEIDSDEEFYSRPARMISMNAGARFAEAAERRLQLAKLNETRSNSNQSTSEISIQSQDTINSTVQETPSSSSSIPTPSSFRTSLSPSVAEPSLLLSQTLSTSSADYLPTSTSSLSIQSPPPVTEAAAIVAVRNRPLIPNSRRTMNELRAMFESPTSTLSSVNSVSSSPSFLPPSLPRRPPVTSPSPSSTQMNSNSPTSTSLSSNIARTSLPSLLSKIPQSDQEHLISPIVPTTSPPRPQISPALIRPTVLSSSSTIIRPPLPTPPSLNQTSIPRLSAYDVVTRMQNEQFRQFEPSTSTTSEASFSRSDEIAIDLSSNLIATDVNRRSAVLDGSRLEDVERESTVGEIIDVRRGEESIIVADDFEYTDLDLLLARLEDRTRDGSNYDELMLVSEVLGSSLSPSSSLSDIESLNIAKVELDRRRIDKFGKVKQKLSVVGVRCGDCCICLGRFKVGAWAVVLPKCFHIFHADCIRSWLLRSQVCPLCRIDAFETS